MLRKRASLSALSILLIVAGTTACSEKGLRGVQPGQTLEEAKDAFEPIAGEASWSTRGEVALRYVEKGAPRTLALGLKDGKVASVRAVYPIDNLRAAGIDPVTFEFDARQRLTKGAVGGFEHGAVEVSATPETLVSVREEAGELELGLHDRAALDLKAADCGDARRLAERLDDAVARHLGEDGLRPGEAREEAVRSMRLLAAAAELACPGSSGILTSTADFFMATGAANGALDRYRKALKTDAEWVHRHPADAQGGLGRVTARYRRFDEADEAFRLAIQLAPSPARKAFWARRFADVLHDRMEFAPAAKYYKVYLESVGAGAEVSDLQRVWARLARALLQTEGGCTPAADAVEKGMAVEGASDRARSAMVAAKAFRTIACEPRKKKAAYADLKQAVKLDPLMASEYATLAGYYDREAGDKAILDIMVEQGWLDRQGLRDAQAYQKALRDEARGN